MSKKGKKNRDLLPLGAMPIYLQNNPYILSGYRRDQLPTKVCFQRYSEKTQQLNCIICLKFFSSKKHVLVDQRNCEYLESLDGWTLDVYSDVQRFAPLRFTSDKIFFHCLSPVVYGNQYIFMVPRYLTNA